MMYAGTDLDWCHIWWQAQSLVITMCHDDTTNQARGHTPAALVHKPAYKRYSIINKQ
jgi:hypothetical protein